MKFRKIDLSKKYSQYEAEILDFWEKNHIFEKSIENRKGCKDFIFYEGPPTANAKPGLHHVLARVFKDVILRYQTLSGKKVLRRAGWDTHGLPVELEIEKKLKLTSKSEIEKYGIDKFNALCQESVWNFKSDWEDLTEKIAFWLDLKNPYITYQDSYIENVWKILKIIWDKNLIYQDFKVITHCPRCQTTLSSHEIAQGYKDVTETSVVAKFKILNGKYKDANMLAWTTTPWTLPGNVALAINKNIDYVLIKKNSEEYIIAKKRLEIIGGEYTELSSIQGNKIIGLSYQPLFQNIFKESEKTKDLYTIIDADFVSTEDGTGVVHTAVMYGADDFELSTNYDLPKIHTVNEDGSFNNRVKDFEGQFVKNADKKIIEYLENNSKILKKFDYTHSYPHCWRCDTPVLYYAKNSWYIAVSKIKNDLIVANKEINWFPNLIKDGRFGQWLAEIKDWAISRERYWGTPLPVWRCQTGRVKSQKLKVKSECNNIKLISSISELEKLSGKKIDDLHRPFIDEIHIKCEKCGKNMTREPYVIDVWFDSGAMPFASGEFENNRFPADYICEAIDQTRGWFYTLLAISVLVGEKNPYKNVICLGHINDEFGKKMSKSKGNIIDPWQIIEKYGADSLRFYLFILNEAGKSKNFSEKDLLTTKNQVITTLLNTYNFFQTYAEIDKWDEKNTQKSFLDEWILARLNQTISTVDNSLLKYDILKAGREIENFIADFSQWYIRRSRKNRTTGFYVTTLEIFNKFSIIISPFLPFTAEVLWQAMQQTEGAVSVHLADFPKSQKYNQKIIDEMKNIRDIASLVLAKRAENNIKVRQPLGNLKINTPVEISQSGIDIIRDEVNIKNISIAIAKELSVELDLALTPELIIEGKVREYIRAIQGLRKNAGCQYNDIVNIYIDNFPPELEKYKKIIEKETLIKFSKNAFADCDAKDSFENSEILLKIS